MAECRICQCGETSGEELLHQRAPKRTFPSGHVLIREGESQNHIYFLCSGELVIHKDFSGQTFEIARLGRGALVGEMEFLTGNPPAATVTAVSEVEVHLLPFEDFQELLSSGDPNACALLLFLAKVLAHRLESMDKKVVEMLYERQPVMVEEFRQFRKKLLEEWEL